MSLRTTYGDANKLTSTGLCVRYACEEQSGLYVFTRYASKTYAYVGMTYDCAKDCAAAKRTQYLRRHNRVSVTAPADTTTSTTGTAENTLVYEALCTISTTHGDGDSWDVEIQVNETEQRAAESSDVSPDSLFAAENSWDYDEGAASASTGAITLNSASGKSGGTSIATSITSPRDDFSPGSAILNVSFGDSSAVYTCASATKTGDNSWSATWSGSTALASDETSVKITFGAATSNTVTFTPA